MKRIKKKYQGNVIPLITPLTPGLALDEAAVERIVIRAQDHGAMPFVMGTTGESVSLSNALKHDYIRQAARLKRQGTQLYAGISSNSLEEAVVFGKQCFDEGADAVAATLPSYYQLTEYQMKNWFEQLADGIGGPLIIYNIPATTHMSIPLDLINDLSRHEFIVGTKDSERNEQRLHDSLALWRDRPDFSHFLGWAAKSAMGLENGSDGLIPSTGNLHPALYQQLERAVAEGDMDHAYYCQVLSDRLGDIYQSGRTLGGSLWALKVLMSEFELCESFMMPPLTGGTPEDAAKLKEALRKTLSAEELPLSISRP
ncbi:dihydrodipicolinate synthase family protein [Hufsiella ginkgonis]|uniref:Dihydrodipicolinate synthase family protein n=1 Tax=Hufsiella ginkgonis TaxID=2695274 RepID=A0A7K1XWR4_9SPHI|nr:dihydrodipicolinate synthase family protein [Hufsiella ginkgonis]MXV15209.1 dihydrodipicolinate synthase family protein [Hufsiella ginkgonis]